MIGEKRMGAMRILLLCGKEHLVSRLSRIDLCWVGTPYGIDGWFRLHQFNMFGEFHGQDIFETLEEAREEASRWHCPLNITEAVL